MTTKPVPTYHPKLDPERAVLSEKKKFLIERRMAGLKGTTRWGEEYISTCHCQAYIVTVHEDKVSDFEKEHEGHMRP
jgi:hypothetical protein